jgi:ATP-dependent Clp protease ATP-binding subunit ClpC
MKTKKPITRFTRVAIKSCHKLSRKFYKSPVGLERVFHFIAKEKEGVIDYALEDLQISSPLMGFSRRKIGNRVYRRPKLYKHHFSKWSSRAKIILSFSIIEAKKFCNPIVATEHILLGISLEASALIRKLLALLETNNTTIRKGIFLNLFTEYFYTVSEPYEQKSPVKRFGIDYNSRALKRKLGYIIGRRTTIDHAIQILCRQTKNNVILVGEPGVGKTSIIEGLAQRITDGSVPLKLLRKRVISLDMTAIVADIETKSEFERRLKELVEQIKKTNDVLLVIDNMKVILGSENSISAPNVLKEALSRSEIQCLVTTTQSEYKAYVKGSNMLTSHFHSVIVNEPTEYETIKILYRVKKRYEEYHKVQISDDAIINAVRLSKQYLIGRFLPEKAIDLLDECASKVKMKKSKILDRFNPADLELDYAIRTKKSLFEKGLFEDSAKFREREYQIKSSQIGRNLNKLTRSNAIVLAKDVKDVISS